MQLVLSLVIVISCTYIGVGIGKYYKERYKFFLDMYNFSSYLQTNLSFRQDALNEVVDNFIKENKIQNQSKKFLNDFQKNLKQNQNFDATRDNIDEDEKFMLNNLFNSLGKTDSDTQNETIEHFKQQLNNKVNEAKKEMTKFVGMSGKLGLIFGLIIVICLI